MNKIDGVKPEYITKTEPVPVGCYVGQIIGVKIESSSCGDYLALAVDITEGEYAGYYNKRYENDKKLAKDGEVPKFKGSFRLTIPVGDGSEKDVWAINRFNRTLGAVEKSNLGYNWNWDEKTLVGKKVGLVFREREWEFNGKTGMTTEIGMICTVDDAKENKITMSPRLLDASKTRTSATAGVKETDEELPF